MRQESHSHPKEKNQVVGSHHVTVTPELRRWDVREENHGEVRRTRAHPRGSSIDSVHGQKGRAKLTKMEGKNLRPVPPEETALDYLGSESQGTFPTPLTSSSHLFQITEYVLNYKPPSIMLVFALSNGGR